MTEGPPCPPDVFARWGGEEFVLAIPGATDAQVAAILDGIRICVPESRTCSIGYTKWRDGETIDSTIARADAALCDAKSAGRNNVAGR